MNFTHPAAITLFVVQARPAESGFYAKATEEQIKLLAMGELEQLIKGDHAHMPLSDIIFQLIKMGHMNKALKLKSDFKVPDKRCIVASFCSLPMHCVAGFGGSSSKRLQPPTNGVSTAHSSGYMLCLSLFDFRAKLPTWASWKSFI